MKNSKALPTPQPFRIAVMSDLHCRLVSDSDDSFLTVGALRTPACNHPVQALLQLIESQKLVADALLVPGDLTNKICLEGFSQAWDLVLEVGNALDTDEIIPVLGNHDVDSKKIHNADAVYFARFLRPGFPFNKDGASATFFSDGSAVLNLQKKLDLILVNSVIDHNDEATAKRGDFNAGRIELLKARLKKELKAPMKMCMLHHHPILHTGPYLDSRDVIPNGDALIEALKDAGCRFILHGHRHHPRLVTMDGTTIFGAGSFSANLGKYGSSVGNLFHVIELDESQPHRGRIFTWTFQLTKGWSQAHREFSGFPYSAGFGATASIDAIVTTLARLAKAKVAINEHSIPEEDVIAAIPEIPFLTPSQYKDLALALPKQGMKLLDADHGRFEIGVQSGRGKPSL